MPSVGDDPGAWAAELCALGCAGGGVVISGSDAVSEWLSAHRDELPASLTTFESRTSAHVAVMNKHELYRIAAEAGVRTPWMHHVSNRADLDGLDDLDFPCILKATLGHVARNLVGFGTLQLDSRADLMGRARQLLDHGLDVVLTEMVPGPETSIEGATTGRDSEGRYPLEFTRRKVRQWVPDYGAGTLVEAMDAPDTRRLNRQLLEHAGYVGVSSCETKRHAGNGHVYLIEVNVRVSNYFGLAEACGVEGAWRLYATLAGLPLGSQPAQVDGRKVVFPEMDVRAAAYRVRRGDARVRDVLASLRGVRDCGSFALRDPAPGLAVAGGILRNRMRRIARAAHP
jgi:predicted ATP-grasp superfamily ATP-dependent carboligase